MQRHATYEAKTAGNGQDYWSTTGENGERLARSGETFADERDLHHNALLTAEAILHDHPDQAAIRQLVEQWATEKLDVVLASRPLVEQLAADHPGLVLPD